jgi:hypothetical protein
MKRRHAALLLIFLPLAVSPRADGTTRANQVTMSASAATVTIGERIELRVMARVGAGISAMHVQVTPGAFEVIARRALPPAVSAAGSTLEEVITIAFFQTGDFAIGPFPIKLLPGQDGSEEKTGRLAIHVRSLLEESDKDIKPLKEPLPLGGDPRHLLPYAAVSLLLLLLAALFLLLRKRAQGRRVLAVVPPPPPEDELEASLQRLRQGGLLPRGEYRAFFIALSAMLKRFIQRAYGFNAEECTTAETVPRLRESEADAAIVSGLEAVLTQADLAKFARRIPGDGEVAALWPVLDSIVASHRAHRQQAREADHVQAGR